jgi:hypothetical protein
MENTYKFSPSQLNDYQYFLDHPTSVEEYVKKLVSGFQTSPAMQCGTAYHRLIENGIEKENTLFYDDNRKTYELKVPAHIMLPALEYRKEFDFIFHEVIHRKEFDVFGRNVILSTRVDGIIGDKVHEHKTTTNKTRGDFYDSWQWKIYCIVFGVQEVRYNVFTWINQGYFANFYKATTPQEYIDQVERVEYTHFTFNAYNGMEEDVKRFIQRFIIFIEENNISHLFLNK